MEKDISFILNHKSIVIHTDPLKRLLDVLRDNGLKGIKEGCGEGECGACAVMINGALQYACLTLVGTVEGMDVLTIEGLRETKAFEILEQAFIDAGAVQCGYCTPGMIMASFSLLKKNATPSKEEIKQGLSGNLCRCTGYNMIIDAVQLAAKKGGGVW